MKLSYTLTILACALMSMCVRTCAQQNVEQESRDVLPRDRMIYFSLNNDKLLDVVNRLSAKKQVNVVLPTDQKKLAETTVTFSVAHKIPVWQAWELMMAMLNVAGFSVAELDKYTYAIKPIEAAVREAAPLYVNAPVDMLPRGELVIRYLYYFQNINLKDADSKANLDTILKDMLPTQQNVQYSLDDPYNSLLITGGAQMIRSIMSILRELDQSGFRESIQVVPIVHTSAREVWNVINQLIPQRTSEDQFRFPLLTDTKRSSKTYFSSNTRVVNIDQNNSLAIFGSNESVQRVKEFVKKYLDKPVEADKTVLHVKTLKYLDASQCADTLNKLITAQSDTGQSTGDTTNKLLSGVIIQAEKEETAKSPEGQENKIQSTQGVGISTTETQTPQGVLIGGNNLIIACTQRDWRIVEKLIDQIDTEQWQVAIEVLIVDITYEAANQLNTQLRRIVGSSTVPDAFKWQSAQMNSPVVNYLGGTYDSPSAPINSSTGINANLLSQQPDPTSSYNLATAMPAGATIFSFKDGNGINAVVGLLRNIDDAKIISQPFVITKNNEPAKVLSLETHWVQGPVEPPSVGGTAVVKYFARNAATEVIIKPRISMPPDNINLDISVKANDFISTDVITKRTVVTNANVGNRQVLVLGGIAKSGISDNLDSAPIISRIPLLGYLFKGHARTYDHRVLMIFVVPTRIAPVSVAGRGVSDFAHSKIEYLSNHFVTDSTLIGCPRTFVGSHGEKRCLQDPIARILFYPEDAIDMSKSLKEYEERGDWMETELGTPVPKKDGTGAKKPEKPVEPKTDKLKNILKDEKNPVGATPDKLKGLLKDEKNPIPR